MAESTLTLRQGVASGFVWPITDAAGAPADLTGYTARCQVRVREDPDAELLAELTASVVGSTVVVQWTAEESLLWDWPSGYSDALLIDIEAVSLDGTDLVVTLDDATVLPGVPLPGVQGLIDAATDAAVTATTQAEHAATSAGEAATSAGVLASIPDRIE